MNQRISKLAAIAAFIGLAGVGAGAHAADADNGKNLVASHNCSACHGSNLNNPVSPEYPKLAGQFNDYLFFAMRSYQVGGGNPLFGRTSAIMAAQVQGLSESDLRDIAAYIESLPGDLVQKK
ncbi:MAG TPA: c-type cytochrome [Pararobbsia sp.]|jgi:cytochrome c553|nr:c-type cytochrome [Pararobbsia sp.]